MAWSTSQLADLAGTTVKTVRYYHQVSVLAEPGRGSNGYKQYGAAHLVQLLRIKRLTDLGVPLARIRELQGHDEHPEEVLRELDVEIGARIEHLQRVRSEVALLLEHRAPADLPAGFSHVAAGLSDSDRAMILIYSRLYDDTAMDDLRRLVAVEATAADAEFTALAADADEAARADLARRYAPEVRAALRAHPSMEDRHAHLVVARDRAFATIAPAMLELYNPAQIDVLVRLTALNEAADAVDAVDDARTHDDPTLPKETP